MAFKEFLLHSLGILTKRIEKNNQDSMTAIDEFKELVTTLDSSPTHPIFNLEHLPSHIVQPDGSIYVGTDGSMMNVNGFDRIGWGCAFGVASSLNRGGTVEHIHPSPFIGEFTGARHALEISHYNRFNHVKLIIDNDSARNLVQELRDMTDTSVLDTLFRNHPHMHQLLKDVAYFVKLIPKLELIDIKSHTLSITYVAALNSISDDIAKAAIRNRFVSIQTQHNTNLVS